MITTDKSYFEDMESRIPRGRTRTRFAPSPTGFMHIGNLRTALFTWLIARKDGGDFILRVEDTDQNRLVEGSLEVIYKTLAECRLDNDEGPDVGGPAGPYIQSERREIYHKYAELLVERGAAYRCFCQKSTGAETEGFVKTDDPCRSLSEAEIEEKLKEGAPFVIRQKIPHEGTTTFSDLIFGEITTPNDTLDDGVLIKSDGLPTYNLANVLDDHLMGITHVVRGSEYLASAPKYELLYKALGWKPPYYVHCPPVMRDARNKMSKRAGDPSYEDLIAKGFLSEAVVNYVALLGWSPGGEREIFTLDELVGVFEISGISKSPAIFDMEKLTYFNSEYIRALSPQRFADVARPFIREAVKNPEVDPDEIAPLLQQRTEVLTDIPEKLDFFDNLPEYDIELYTNKKSKTDAASSLEMLKTALPALEKLSDWTQDGIHGTFTGLAETLGVKNAKLMWPVRIAVSGKSVTPGGAVELCRILGKSETLRRLRLGIEKLEA